MAYEIFARKTRLHAPSDTTPYLVVSRGTLLAWMYYYSFFRINRLQGRKTILRGWVKKFRWFSFEVLID